MTLLLMNALAALRTPALLLLVVLAVAGWMKLKRLEELLRGKAELQALNNVGAKVSRIDKEFGKETSKTRIAVAALAQKCEAPEVLKDFLKGGDD